MRLGRAKSPSDSNRLVLRFALVSLAAFLLIGAAVAVVVSSQLRRQAESSAEFHAQTITNSVLRYEFEPRALAASTNPGSAHYERLLRIAESRVVRFPVVRLKLWSSDGRILFSDERRLVGKQFRLDSAVRKAFHGKVSSRLEALTEPEHLYDRSLGRRLLATYVPLYPEVPDRTARPIAVAEIYQDYEGIKNEGDRLFATLTITLLIGLTVLYVLLLPLANRVARTLGDQNATLQAQARRLTELLQQEQQTVSELRELNKLKSNFVAVASHELRSPLTAILGNAKTLTRPEFQNDAAMRVELLKATERQADRLFRLVENLLIASQLEDHRINLHVTPIPFVELVREVVEGFGPRGHRIEIKVPAELPPVVTDRGHLVRIVTNLIDNALKYSPKGGPVEVGARKGAWRGGDGLVFWVRDHGVGIPSEQLSKIFERFYQGDSSSTRPFGGVGLGLSLVRDLVQILGGRIDVASEVGEGSQFTITMPLRHPSAKELPKRRYDENGQRIDEAAEPAAEREAVSNGPVMTARGPVPSIHPFAPVLPQASPPASPPVALEPVSPPAPRN